MTMSDTGPTNSQQVEGAALIQLPSYLQPEVYQAPTNLSDIKQFVAPPTIKLVRPMTLSESARNLFMGQPYYMEGDAVPVVDMLPGPNPQKPSEICIPFEIIPILVWRSWAGFIKGTTRVLSFSNNPNSEEARKAEKFFGKDLDEKDSEGNQIKVAYRESINWLMYVPHLEKVCRVVFGSTAKPAGKRLSQLIASRKPEVAPPACRFLLYTKMHDNKKGAPFPQWEVSIPPNGGWNMDVQLYNHLMEEREKLLDRVQDNSFIPDSDDEVEIINTPGSASSM